FQLSYTTAITLLPLHLYAIAGSEDAPRSVGIVLTASALGGAFGATLLGSLSSRIGAARLSAVAFVLTAVCLAPQPWLANALQFGVRPFPPAFSAGALPPARRPRRAEEPARHESTSSSMGAVYGLSQSAHAAGNAVGAALAAGIAAMFGIPATFLVAGV